MLVFIIGAGASASLSSTQVPVMATFFRVAAERITPERKEYWLPFVLTDHAGLFDQNERLGKLAKEIVETNARIETYNGSGRVPPETLSQILSAKVKIYRALFLKDNKRTQANLEMVFDKFLKHAADTGNDGPYKRFQHLINILFSDLDKVLKPQNSVTAYKELAKALSKLLRPAEPAIISFNYDIWLEKALFSCGLWNAQQGYGYNFTHCAVTAEAPLISMGMNQNQTIQVLKPNGSLSWWIADWSYASPNKGPREELFLSGDKDGSVEYFRDPNMEGVSHPAHLPSILKTYGQPLIRPPTSSKYRTHPIDWGIDRKIIKVLREASTIVVIGWSKPEGDDHFLKLLDWALTERLEQGPGQIPRIVVCDVALNPFDPALRKLYFRINSSFRCIELVSWHAGFNKDFVDFLSPFLKGY